MVESSLRVQPIPAFRDNIIWLLAAGQSPSAALWLVDPGEAGPVLAALGTDGLMRLAGILITHHHADHVGGIAGLQHALFERDLPPLPVYGPAGLETQGVTHPVADGDSVGLSEGVIAQVWAIPGHTAEHLGFWVSGAGAFFPGDTLFGAGCGRLLGGTAEQLWQSLQRLAGLPSGTQFYPAHEYTLSNLQFAHAAEPDNSAVAERLGSVRLLRESNTLTLPTLLEAELQTNPFLRASSLEAFVKLRSWKDVFKP